MMALRRCRPATSIFCRKHNGNLAATPVHSFHSTTVYIQPDLRAKFSQNRGPSFYAALTQDGGKFLIVTKHLYALRTFTCVCVCVCALQFDTELYRNFIKTSK